MICVQLLGGFLNEFTMKMGRTVPPKRFTMFYLAT